MPAMTQHLTLLTGASRGMGLAMATQLLAPGRTLLGISRQTSEALALQATQAGATLLQWQQDLSDASAAAARVEAWLAAQAGNEWASVTLINNAGMVPRIAPISHLGAAELANAMRVGLEAPMLLTAAFLRATEHWQLPRKVLNISSGLGRRAMASQAAYCAAKAGMDHFTRCVALEETLKANGAKLCSLAPGVIDTDMQVQLRSADQADFPDLGSFASLKREGKLTSPEEAARRVLAYLDRADFGEQAVADVRD
ncbi:MAG: SDR family NAD(P)-dependent oxidoreductase [Polaromonas sp.]